MNVVIEDRPTMVPFGTLKIGDYFVTGTGDLFRKKRESYAHKVTAQWPTMPETWFSEAYYVFKAEITAIHVKVVN